MSTIVLPSEWYIVCRANGCSLNAFFKDSLEDFSEDATVDEGLKILKLNSLQDKLPGANFVLLPHRMS